MKLTEEENSGMEKVLKIAVVDKLILRQQWRDVSTFNMARPIHTLSAPHLSRKIKLQI